MKKFSLLAAVALVLGLSVNAQVRERTTNFKVNIISPAVRTGSFFFEQKISATTTGQLGVFYTGYSFDNLKLRGYGITPEFRYYASPNKGAMDGFYVAPFLRYQDYTLTEDGNEGKFTSFGGGLLIGNQWMLKGGLNIDLFIGPSLTTGTVKIKSGTDNFDLPFGIQGFGIRSGLTVGFAF